MANLYYDPDRKIITAKPLAGSNARPIKKEEVPALIRDGAEVDQTARDLNRTLKFAG